MMTSTLIYGQSASGPPPQDFAWPLEKGVSTLRSNFTIQKKGAYVFAVLFHLDPTTDSKATKDFLGDGSYKFVVDTSSDAKRLIPGVDGSLASLNVQANQGKIIRRSANPGTKISVRVEIERSNINNAPTLSRVIHTEGVSGYLPGAQFRLLIEPTLEPGEYKMSAYALDLPKFPDGMRASLAVMPPWRY